MTNRFKFWLITVLTLIILTGIFIGGFYTYPKVYPPPVFTSSHTVIYDTAKKHIYSIWPWYIIEQKDSVIINEIPAEVDTVAILTAFYSTYQYTRTFEDSTLKAVLMDRVTQNKPAVISFDYTIKRPQQIIQNNDNSISYTKYLYVGGSIPLYDAKMANLGLFVAFPRGMAGIEYIPYNKSVSLTGAFTLFKFK